jgi:hypothetical protein
MNLKKYMREWRKKHPNYQIKWRKNHPGYYLKKMALYSKTHPDIVKKCRYNFDKNHPGRRNEITRKSIKKRIKRQPDYNGIKSKKYIERYPQKHKCHQFIFNLRCNSDFVNEDCALCFLEGTEAHHENYKLPNVLIFLCKKHHGNLNRGVI